MHCWFARDITTAMLVFKNWELNYFHANSAKTKLCCTDHQHGPLVTLVANQEQETSNKLMLLELIVFANVMSHQAILHVASQQAYGIHVANQMTESHNRGRVFESQ